MEVAMSLRWAVTGVFATMLCSFAADAAELVITESTIIGLEPGMVIDGGQELSLRKGHKISLISPDGKVIKLEGPYKGIPDPAEKTESASKLTTALSTLVAGQGRDSSQLGAVRDAASARGQDPFKIDISAAGDQCVVEGKDMMLWLPSGSPVDSLWIARVGGSEAAMVKWPKGEAQTQWPANLAVADGAEYQMLRQPAKEETTIRLHVIPGGKANNAELAIMMQEKECLVQAFALLTAPTQ
jgi:hypothetical protein